MTSTKLLSFWIPSPYYPHLGLIHRTESTQTPIFLSSFGFPLSVDVICTCPFLLPRPSLARRSRPVVRSKSASASEVVGVRTTMDADAACRQRGESRGRILSLQFTITFYADSTQEGKAGRTRRAVETTEGTNERPSKACKFGNGPFPRSVGRSLGRGEILQKDPQGGDEVTNKPGHARSSYIALSVHALASIRSFLLF